MSQAKPPVARCGMVALAGFPNAGKSTLLNALVGQKISIVSPKPQTTRVSIKGIMQGRGWQAVLVDTPGLLEPGSLLEEEMKKASLESIKDADLVLFMASLDAPPDLKQLAKLPFKPGKTLLILNKIDSADPTELEKLGGELAASLKPLASFKISARAKKGLGELQEFIQQHLPPGPALYAEDEVTDQNLRQMAAEIVREKVLLFTEQEVPHSVAVAVEDYQERENGLHAISCIIYVERDSQKAIVIGKSGLLLKKIGSAARQEMEHLIGAKVFLNLWVKVAKGWKKDAAFLKRLHYTGGIL